MTMPSEVFQMQQTFGEAFLRSTAIYWGIYLLFRFGGRRNIGFFPAVSRVLSPDRLLLVKDGVLQLKNMRREYVTRAELPEQLRINGVDALVQVRRAFLEANGQISVIKADKHNHAGGAGVQSEAGQHATDPATQTGDDNEQ